MSKIRRLLNRKKLLNVLNLLLVAVYGPVGAVVRFLDNEEMLDGFRMQRNMYTRGASQYIVMPDRSLAQTHITLLL